MKDATAFDFDSDYGEEYDRIAHAVIPAYDQIFEAGVALLEACRIRPSRLLVAGCGTGREIETFARAFPGMRITGVDPSREMIRACRDVCGREGLDGRVDLVHGTVADLPSGPSFDAATVYNVMHFLPDDGAKEDLLRSVSDRTRAGGRVVLFDLHGDPDSDPFRTTRDAWYAFFARRGLAGEDGRRFIDRLDRGIVYVPESRILEIARAANLVPETRWFTGFLYGGWLLRRA